MLEFYLPQLKLFKKENLQAKEALRFDPQAVFKQIQSAHRKAVLAIDSGGSKTMAGRFSVGQGDCQLIGPLSQYDSRGGEGFIQFFEKMAVEAKQDKLAVGISCAGLVEGTKLLGSANAPVFCSDLQQLYQGDFAEMFGDVTLVNDNIAALMAASARSVRFFPKARNFILIGNGTGLGAAVLTDDILISLEPGHVELTPALNPFNQTKPCDFLQNKATCIESVAAQGAGIEDLWYKLTGEMLDGRAISEQFLKGNKLAVDLYDNSAFVTAHMLAEVASAFDLFKEPEETVIFYSGWIFDIEGYIQRLTDILIKNLRFNPQTVLTNNISQNIVLEGAAIAVFTKFSS